MTVLTTQCELGVTSGLRVAIKDSLDIQGLPTRLGSAACEQAVPATRHAVVVERILQAGHRIIGKTVMHELAFGITGLNSHAGTPLNTRYPELIPGGSSSGSAAAVAAGLADYAIGTDTGGSVRVPAACCGVFGFKPTFDRVSRCGVWPGETSLDCVGAFAGDLDTLETAQRTIDPSFNVAGSGDHPVRFSLVSGLRANAEITGALEQQLGQHDIPADRISLTLLEDAFEAGLVIINAETAAAAGVMLETGRVGSDVAARLVNASRTTATEVTAANQVRRAFTAEADQFLQPGRVLLLPTLPEFPITLAQAQAGTTDLRMTALVRPFNLSGHPAMTIPFEVAGRPAGIQLVGRRGADEEVFLAARELLRRLCTA